MPMPIRMALLSLPVLGLGLMAGAACAQDSEEPARALVQPLPYDGADFDSPGLFPYLVRWATQSSDAVAAMARLFPNHSTAVAPLDLDQDGTAELVVRFTEQCLPETTEDSNPTCAHAVMAWNGEDFQTVLSRYASRVFEVRNAEGEVGIAFDGLAFAAEGLAVSLLSPSIAKWGNPIAEDDIAKVRKALAAPASVGTGDLFVASLETANREPAYIFARNVAPFYNWMLLDRDLAPIITGRSDALPSAVAYKDGKIELVSTQDGRFITSQVELPLAASSVFSLANDELSGSEF